MSDARLPAHMVVSGLIRGAEAAGGFATVISKGEKDSGILLILTMERGEDLRLWERMPRLDGSRPFLVSKTQDIDNKKEFDDYLRRRIAQDPDSWLIELDVPNPERLIAQVTG